MPRLTIEKYKQSLIEDLCEFVRIPSRSSPTGGEEGVLQRLIAEKMISMGARLRVFEASDIPGFFEHELCCGPDRNYADRPTVIGELGPANAASALLILAHSDTVQIFEPDKWTFDPFCGEIREGKVCGLGASDDKWGLAAMLGIMRILKDSKRQLKKKLIFASTMDEENGVGNGTLLLMLAGIKAESSLYLDGNNMALCLGNLGGSFYYLRPRSPIDNQMYRHHAELLTHACKQMSMRRASLFDKPLLSHNVRRDNSLILYDWKDENGPYFNLAFYTVPGESREPFCRELEALVAQALGDDHHLYEASYLHPWFDAAIVSQETSLVGYLAEALRDVLRREPTLTTISKQDSFVLTNRAGIPTVAFGPRTFEAERGSAHKPDESIDIEEAWDGFKVAYAAIERWLENGECK